MLTCISFLSSGSSNIQYSPANLSSTPSPPSHSPGTGGEGSINSVSLVPGNVNIPGQDGIGGVQVLVDSGAASPGMLVQGGNRGRGRGGRGGRGRGGGRGRRSTSGPPPEIDHNIEVNAIIIIKVLFYLKSLVTLLLPKPGCLHPSLLPPQQVFYK